MIINSLWGGGKIMSRSINFLLIAAISAVVLSGCKKERSFRGANPGDEIVFGGTAGSASGFRSSKTKGGDGDSSASGAFAGAGLDASEMESCGSYGSDADETFFFDWEDFEGGEGFGGSDANALFGTEDSDVQTKTEYSGDKNNVGGKTYERIDWVVGDKVKIFANGVKPPKTECVYEVNHVRASGIRSSAGLRPFNEADGHGLMWDSGNADFYAFYPGDNPSKVFAFNTPSNFDVTVKLLKEQNTFTKTMSGNHTEFKPDMELAAMMAVSRNVSPTPSVQLDFLPLVTTFRITMSNSLPNDDMKINKVSLVYSPSAPTPVPPLSGDYAVKYDKTSGSTLSSHSSAGLQPVNASSITSPAQEISVDLGTDAVALTKNNGNSFSVTLFAVPVIHKGLQLKVNFTVNGKTEDNLLDLKQKSPGDWLQFEPYKKYDIRIGAGKNWIFHLEATDISVSYIGGVVSSQMKSYKTYGSKTKPVPWHVVGYSNIGASGPFTDPCPSWLTGFPSNGNGISDPTTHELLTATVSQQSDIANPNARTMALRSKSEVGTKAEPIILSFLPVPSSGILYNIPDGAVASDYYSNPENTANCYVVTRPGWYKIPLEYGNSVKNNIKNLDSYRPSGSGSHFLTPFVDHDGNAITAEGIRYQVQLNNAVPKLVWQDFPLLVQDMEFEKHSLAYITFHVSKKTIHEGNAIIALKESASGEIVWSWHIWVYGGDDLRLINVKNNRGKLGGKPGNDSFNFLSENLGACYDSGESVSFPEGKVWVKFSNGIKTKVIEITRQAGPSFTTATKYNCTYYQWGRKDPMLPSDGTGNNKLCFDGYGTLLWYFPHNEVESNGTAPQAKAEIAYTIKNPGTYNSSYNMDNLYYNLWDVSYKYDNLTYSLFQPVIKSIYDPCPPGLCLPPDGAFTGFTSTGENSYNLSELNVSGPFNNGYNFRTVLKEESGGETIFFPVLGSRNGDGGLFLFDREAHYWTSLPYTEDRGCQLYFRSNDVNPAYTEKRSNGFVLRPVAEN